MSQPKLVVITGASDGIGATAARQLHHDGHQVVIVGRSPEKTKAAAAELRAAYFITDFTRLDEVRQLAADLDRSYSHIDVLANNAGGVFGERAKTVDGFEKTFQVNHLAPFLLTTLLMDKLTASHASVIQTSTLHGGLGRRLDVDDLNLENSYSAVRAYGLAKLENTLFTKELHRRYHGVGLAAAALSVSALVGPGMTAESGPTCNAPGPL